MGVCFLRVQFAESVMARIHYIHKTWVPGYSSAATLAGDSILPISPSSMVYPSIILLVLEAESTVSAPVGALICIEKRAGDPRGATSVANRAQSVGSSSVIHEHKLAPWLEARRFPDADTTKGVFIGTFYVHGCCILPGGRSRPALPVMVTILALTQKA